MSFTVSLQTNTSPDNQLTKALTAVTAVDGVLRAGTSIIDPVIQIAGDVSAVTGCNYMSIPAFGRSYFIRDIRSLRNGLYEVTGHVDVLGTYATQIRGNSGIVRRQETKWNLYLQDAVFKQYQYGLITLKTFPSGFNTNKFVLAVAGGAV